MNDLGVVIFDSHAHYDDERFEEDRDKVIEDAFKQGVGRIINVACSVESTLRSIELSEKYDYIYASAGIHPHEAGSIQEKDLELLAEYANHKKVIAIGEIGLDYYYDFAPRDIQKYWFARQINLAEQLGMPIIIHNRDSHEDIMEIVKKENARQVGGVFHCYSGSAEMAREILKLNFYISVGGAITFKNARRLLEVVKYVPMDRLLIETDCPYMTPEPFRGKRNHSGYLTYVIDKIAEIKGIEAEQVRQATTDNAGRLFSINTEPE